MVSSIQYLLVDELFREELSSAISMLEHEQNPSEISLALSFDEDGNISTLNHVHLQDGLRHNLSYLIGSINFLFNLIIDGIEGETSVRGEPEDLLSCKKQVVLLAVDLLIGLSKISSPQEVGNVIENIYQRKMTIRKQLVQ